MKAKITQSLLRSVEIPEKPIDIRDTQLTGFILRCHPTGRMLYFVEYRRSNGKKTRYKLGLANKLTVAQARDAAKEFLANLELGDDLGESRRKNNSVTLGTYLKETYGPWVETNRKAGKGTLKRLISAFEPLSDYKLSELTIWTMEKWRNEKRKKRKVTAATLNREIAMLKAAINLAVTWEIIDVHPFKGLKKLPERDSKTKIRYLSPEEETQLKEALDVREERIRLERDSANAWREERGYKLLPGFRKVPFADHLKPMVLLSLNTGLRRGELFQLSWKDIDLKQSSLHIRAETSKSGKSRYIALNKTAKSTLKDWNKSSSSKSLIFPNKEGKPFNHVNKSWRNLLLEAGITEFRWHDMRHDFASKLVMAGIDLNTVRELLGHSDLKMTLVYAHLAPEHKQMAVDKLDLSVQL